MSYGQEMQHGLVLRVLECGGLPARMIRRPPQLVSKDLCSSPPFLNPPYPVRPLLCKPFRLTAFSPHQDVTTHHSFQLLVASLPLCVTNPRREGLYDRKGKKSARKKAPQGPSSLMGKRAARPQILHGNLGAGEDCTYVRVD